ncbi:MAG: hypothetical protein OEW17_09350 [Gemmatimonadota bacterium]|nr:hypothetical protein [Gemmatimonadota bacterium]MDH4349000.1 hypothetical protein [Gemmatimonadota bacterium]MDH5282323.1 hypothetical protein [Gemmatimonadota bacterium]
MMQPPALASTLLATLDPAVSGASFCVPGFCPSAVTSGPPSGLMFLAVGLVAAGMHGLLRRRSQRR